MRVVGSSSLTAICHPRHTLLCERLESPRSIHRGAPHDSPSPPHARGHAGAESLAAHASLVRPAGLPLCPPLRPIAGRPGPRGDPGLPGLFDQRAEAGAQLHLHRRVGASVSLHGHAQDGLASRRGDPRAEKTADVAGGAQPRGSDPVSRLRHAPQASHDPDDVLRRGPADLGSRPAHRPGDR